MPDAAGSTAPNHARLTWKRAGQCVALGAFGLALAFGIGGACGKGNGGSVGTPVPGPVPGGVPGTLPPPDGGTDGGTDGGLDGGFGCAGSVNRINRMSGDCFSAPFQAGSATMQDSVCSATLFLNNSPLCTGTLSGPNDAFTGTCEPLGTTLQYSCIATSIPGLLQCTAPGGRTCSIAACNTLDGGSC